MLLFRDYRLSLKLSNSHQNNPDGWIALQVRGTVCLFNFWVNCPFNLLCFHCVMGVSEHEGVFPMCTYPSSVGNPPSSRWPVCRAACPVIHSVVAPPPSGNHDLNPAPERLMQFMAPLLCLARSFKQGEQFVNTIMTGAVWLFSPWIEIYCTSSRVTELINRRKNIPSTSKVSLKMHSKCTLVPMSQEFQQLVDQPAGWSKENESAAEDIY